MQSLEGEPGVQKHDVTTTMGEQMQTLLDEACISSTFGSGRDAQDWPFDYNRLVVSKVTRIESPPLWRAYQARRSAMIQQISGCVDVPGKNVKSFAHWQLPLQLERDANEVFLFHGTKPNLINTIAEHGFDGRVGALNGWFGGGIYFGEMCSKTDQYCTTEDDKDDDPEGCTFYMFVARVCLGFPHDTDEPMRGVRRPPTMAQVPGRAHDSIHFHRDWDPQRECFCHDRAEHHHYDEFIVYDQAQTYPEYLIEFHRKKV
jgi:hypothetical protein